jgi:hypothetical protein
MIIQWRCRSVYGTLLFKVQALLQEIAIYLELFLKCCCIAHETPPLPCLCLAIMELFKHKDIPTANIIKLKNKLYLKFYQIL